MRVERSREWWLNKAESEGMSARAEIVKALREHVGHDLAEVNDIMAKHAFERLEKMFLEKPRLVAAFFEDAPSDTIRIMAANAILPKNYVATLVRKFDE